MNFHSHSVRLALCGAMAFSAGALAQSPAQAPPAKTPAKAATPAAAPAAPPCMDTRAQEHMQAMRRMHESMAAAKTPAERARLRDEQWKLMQQGMGTMRGMPGYGMGMGMGTGSAAGRPGAMGAGMPMHGAKAGAAGATCVGQRMAMMEMMMQMMMDRMAPETPGK